MDWMRIGRARESYLPTSLLIVGGDVFWFWFWFFGRSRHDHHAENLRGNNAIIDLVDHTVRLNDNTHYTEIKY